ncbi:MAG: 2-hydroxyacyl-CoA dehydratase family protein [Verrucomicrobia bacterium]|nr:2-hydroxyacyl-CoA dehydratase family protein [Verrucomicrobiota bacterium]
MVVFYTSPWVPPEWIKAHGLEPRGIWQANDFTCESLPLAAGVCAFANAAVSLAERQPGSAVVFTSHCDQLRRGFDSVAHAVSSRAFLFNLPVTWQTPVAQQIYRDELRRLGQFLIGLGGHVPATEELSELMTQYSHARSRLLEAAAWCAARPYAEAVARFHLDGSVNLPPVLDCLQPQQLVGQPGTNPPSHRITSLAVAAGDSRVQGTNSVPLALVGGPLPQSQMPLLDAIEKAGGRVVLNATEAGERSLWPKCWPNQAQGPEAERSIHVTDASVHETAPDSIALRPAPAASNTHTALTDLLAHNYLTHCVDVFQRPNTRLYDWLRPRLADRKARGIMLWHYVGCDLWRAEAQSLREAFGLPVLLLTADETMPQRNTGRLEAFLESLR